jgi:hypothetical protein
MKKRISELEDALNLMPIFPEPLDIIVSDKKHTWNFSMSEKSRQLVEGSEFFCCA